MALALSLASKRARDEELSAPDRDPDRLERFAKRSRVDNIGSGVVTGIVRMYRQLVPATDRPESTMKKIRRRTARECVLENFLDIPIDVMELICNCLAPHDILSLSQTSRAIRRLLFNKAYSTVIWKRAREKMHFFSCPQELSEPQLAKLLFDSDCYACGYHGTRKLKTCYTLKLRLCCPCLAQNFVQGSKHMEKHGPDLVREEAIYHLIPYFGSHHPDMWAITRRPLRWAAKQLFFRDDFDKAIGEYIAVRSDPERLKKLVEERKQETKKRIEAGVALANEVRQMETAQCRERAELARVRREKRMQEREAIGLERRDKIKRRLRALGYTDYDLETYKETYAENWKLWMEAPRKLTRKEWSSLLPKLEALILIRKQKWREHMHCLISSKRKWDLQVAFFSVRTEWKGKYHPSMMDLSFADICSTPQAKAYLDPKSEMSVVPPPEWWDGLLKDITRYHLEQAAILAACCKFCGIDVAEEHSTNDVIHYKASIFDHAIAFCWDCMDPEGDVETYANRHARAERECYFHGLTGKRDPDLEGHPQVDPLDLVPSIFLQDNLLKAARSSSNPAFIASCLFFALERSLNLASTTSMHEMEELGNRFVCMRCPPYKRVTQTWSDLVNHMVSKDQEYYLSAQEGESQLEEELKMHDITLTGALVRPVPGELMAPDPDYNDPSVADVWNTALDQLNQEQPYNYCHLGSNYIDYQLNIGEWLAEEPMDDV